MNYNRVFLLGHISQDLEVKETSNGTLVLNFQLATNRSWKDKGGERQHQVDFHDITAFGKTAEIISKYRKKGEPVFLIGRLQTRRWERDGEQKQKTEIIAESVLYDLQNNEE